MLAGYARPGQTSWQLLASFDLDVLLDFAYGEIVRDLKPEQKAEIDRNLEEASQDRVGSVEYQRVDGSVVQISQARIDRMRANAQSMANRARKGQVVR